jgi:hypothetical protein
VKARQSARVLVCVAAALVATRAVAQAPAREAAYAALAQLPDWSGWWRFDTPPTEEFRLQPPPIKPGSSDAQGPVGRLRGGCRPLTFTGITGSFQAAVEFLFTPGRVTVTTEGGLVRRIYTDGRTVPADADPTNTGISIGRWEGQTLVVETSLIDPHARYPLPPNPRAPAIGENARITERIALKDEHTLEIEVVAVAPDALTEPDRRTRIYKRLPKTMPAEFTTCTEYDRSIDPVSGEQRFDLTPPRDLPPPPPRRE